MGRILMCVNILFAKIIFYSTWSNVKQKSLHCNAFFMPKCYQKKTGLSAPGSKICKVYLKIVFPYGNYHLIHVFRMQGNLDLWHMT